jgi:hypothetical protein
MRGKVSKMFNDKKINIVNWLDELKIYAGAFHKELCSKDEEFKNIVKYDESIFDKVFEKYKIYRAGFHTLIEGDLIDRHKILAAIMLAATDKENLIFKVDDEAIRQSSKKDFPYWVIFPNEYFLYTILLRILTDYVLTTKKSKKFNLLKKEYDIRFPDQIVWWEDDKTQPYAEQFCKLLSTLIIIDDIAIKCSLLASHLICFYEIVYDCAVKELSKTYYN